MHLYVYTSSWCIPGSELAAGDSFSPTSSAGKLPEQSHCFVPSLTVCSQILGPDYVPAVPPLPGSCRWVESLMAVALASKYGARRLPVG